MGMSSLTPSRLGAASLASRVRAPPFSFFSNAVSSRIFSHTMSRLPVFGKKNQKKPWAFVGKARAVNVVDGRGLRCAVKKAIPKTPMLVCYGTCDQRDLTGSYRNDFSSISKAIRANSLKFPIRCTGITSNFSSRTLCDIG